ncbi:integrator complex subunit 3-like [Babylonia areolata]|uniref:integrator complex subunit 3-like n=1 Tax=Babylonia areolata TaxID=304850 RepID=UPI003FCFC51D
MDQSAKQASNSSRIFITSAVEAKDQDEERLERGNNIYTNITKGLSDREAHDQLNAFVSKGPGQHKDIQYGLLYNILAEPVLALKSFQDMMLVSRDGLNTVVTFVINVISAKWLRFCETPKAQSVWLTRELVKQNVKDADELYLLLLRQVVGGDLSSRNIWLAESMLDMFLENRSWLEKSFSPRELVPSVVYTYLRLIIDHKDSAYSVLRQREVELCITLLREKWADCMVIGRDLVRLLQLVARIPEFEKLWRDIFLNPSVLAPNFTGIMQLMSIPSKRHIILSRVTPDMEKKLAFLMLHVQFGSQKRYQEWFQKMYLATPESQSLRCDIIRFICVCLHPSNEQIQSKVLPRWAVIGWLLTTCTSNVAASDAKLALFLDWLVFSAERDNIMNIEPAILVMYNSMKQHPAITATLLDFMCRIMGNFCPRHSTEIREGVYSALRTILDKEVLQIANPPSKNLDPLFNNPKLDRELRALVHQNFLEFCSIVKEEPAPVRDHRFGSIDNGSNHISDGVLEGSFSDDEDDLPLSKLQEDDSSTFLPIREPPPEKQVDITEHFGQLLPEVKDLVISLQKEKNQEKRCDVLSELLGDVIQDDDFDQDGASALAACLCHILSDQFNNVFPQGVNDEDTEQAIEESSRGEVLFVIFRFLSDISEGDHRRNQLLLLMGEMYVKQPRTGYLLLYFLKVSKSNDDKMVLYKDFCKSMEVDVKTCLMKDLKLCEEDDVRLFTYLIPDIYTHFPVIAVGNAELVHMIVESIDGTQLQDLICQILQGHLIIFNKRETFLSILNESLNWESIEQYFLWQLITAHNIPIEHMLPVLPMLEYSSNAEALTSLMVLLKQESPSAELLRPMLCRNCKKSDYFVVSVLKYWAQEYEDRLADLIKEQLTRVNGTTKRRTKDTKKDQPSVDQVLAHLDHMRQVCRNISFLNHEHIQHALQQVQATATDSQKSKFSDLLALAEDIEDIRTTRVLRGRRGANSSPKMVKSKRPVDSDSNSDVEEEETNMRHPPKKKKKLAQPALDDDSD